MSADADDWCRCVSRLSVAIPRLRAPAIARRASPLGVAMPPRLRCAAPRPLTRLPGTSRPPLNDAHPLPRAGVVLLLQVKSPAPVPQHGARVRRTHVTILNPPRKQEEIARVNDEPTVKGELCYLIRV